MKLVLTSLAGIAVLIAGLNLYSYGHGGHGNGNDHGDYHGGAETQTWCDINPDCNGWRHAFAVHDASSFADCMGYPAPWPTTCPYLRKGTLTLPTVAPAAPFAQVRPAPVKRKTVAIVHAPLRLTEADAPAPVRSTSPWSVLPFTH